MSPENRSSSEGQADGARGDDMPQIEDAYAPDQAPSDVVGEDDPQLLASAARLVEDETAEDENLVSFTPGQESRVADKDDTSDTDAITEELDKAQEAKPDLSQKDWSRQRTARPIIIELKRIESQVRQLLDGRDTKRKRKLGGTRRWRELEEDIIHWSHGGRFDDATLRDLQQLIARRHYLFGQLRFVAGTRPTWNT